MTASAKYLNWLLVVFGTGLLTFSVLSGTLTLPFFVIDDSDAINKAILYREKIFQGDIFKLFDPDISGSRYWPGFTLYLVLRTALFGTSSMLWHLWQVSLYMICGVLLASLARRITGSYLPGVFAHLLLISTGTAEYQSNWFNFVFTNSFEPLLLLLWLSAAVLTCRALQPGSERRRRLYMSGAVCCLIWSITAKENAAPAGLLFGAPFVILQFVGHAAVSRPHLRPVKLPAVAILGFAVCWILVLLFVLPRESGYAGTDSLVMNPIRWTLGLVAYGSFWIQATHLIIPAGLFHYCARVAAARRFTGADVGQGLLFWAGLCQVASLVVWPEHSMRLSQPGYAFVLLAACVEWYRYALAVHDEHTESGVGPWRAVKIATLAIIIFYLGGKAVLGLPHFTVALRMSFYAWGLIILGSLFVTYRKRSTPHPWTRGSSLAYASWIAAVAIHLIAVNLSSYMAQYHIREGIRHKIVSYVSRVAPEGARVSWLVPPGGDIFAWSAGIHSRLFFNRIDLIQGPHDYVRTQGALKKGDLIVAYGLPASKAPSGQGSLLKKTIEDGGFQAPAQSLREVEKLVVDLTVPPFRVPKDIGKPRELHAQTVVYTVQSDTWTFAPEFEQNFIRKE